MKLRPGQLAPFGFFALTLTAGSAVGLAQTDAHGAGGNSGLAAPLVRLRDIDSSIIQDIRYATAFNFTGAKVDGYLDAECILTASTAKALADVQRDLTSRGFSLKVYDCYRPRRAVANFMRWAGGKAQDRSLGFHPRLQRRQLIEQAYVAAVSGHSRGNVVDLTIVELPERSVDPVDPARSYGDCGGPESERAPDSGVDMGSGFDCFDPKSHVAAPRLSTAQQQSRQMLQRAMTRRGFKGFYREWWHFSFPAGDPGRSFDVPVTANRR